jgi:hypothetical protein
VGILVAEDQVLPARSTPMIAFERTFYRLAIFASALGILFALMKGSVVFAAFDAFMGAWFTNCLREMR